MNYPIVELQWHDAMGDTTWRSRAYLIRECKDGAARHETTVGMKVYEDELYVVMAASYSPETNAFSDTMRIPKSLVTKETPLVHRRGRVKRKK